MKIEVRRQPSDPDWTLSEFYFDGKLMGVGVEDEKREVKVMGETRVDNGIYKVGLHYPSRFSEQYYRDDNGNLIRSKNRTTLETQKRYHTPHEMIHVLDTPRHKYVLWHWGNTDKDTAGCYIVGTAFGVIGGRKGVISSRDKYVRIYPLIWRAIRDGEVTVEYKEDDSKTV